MECKKTRGPEEWEVRLWCGSLCSAAVAEWVRWRDGAGLGFRRSLGWDNSHRRYWALGNAGAAWRIYVEQNEGRSWGYYEGEPSLCSLPLLSPSCRHKSSRSETIAKHLGRRDRFKLVPQPCLNHVAALCTHMPCSHNHNS